MRLIRICQVLSSFCYNRPLMKRFFGLLILCLLFLLPITKSNAQLPTSQQSTYVKGTVQTILSEKDDKNLQTTKQTLQVNILEGKDKGKTVSVTYSFPQKIKEWQALHPGEDVIVVKQEGAKTTYGIYDRFRFTNIIVIVVAFILLVL